MSPLHGVGVPDLSGIPLGRGRVLAGWLQAAVVIVRRLEEAVGAITETAAA